MNILITGGTGFIGRHLTKRFTDDKHLVTVLTRSEKTTSNRYLTYLPWDGQTFPRGIGLYDVVINLAGAGIADSRWTPEHKKEVMESRISATRACVEYINRSPQPPKVFLSASGVGYYGVEHEGNIDESASAGSDFAAEVCVAWEKEAFKAECRTCTLRIGVVLGKKGGALARMIPIYKAFLGGRFASGKQGFPWIQREDLGSALDFLIRTPTVSGPVNISAPQIVDQATFSHALAKALGVIDPMIVPKFGLSLLFGEQAVLFWGGQRIVPRKLQEAGFQWKYPELGAALKAVVG